MRSKRPITMNNKDSGASATIVILKHSNVTFEGGGISCKRVRCKHNRYRVMENEEKLSYEEALKVLSVAEVRVLGLVEKGYTSSEIAQKLGNSKRTIQTHKQNICRKIKVTGRLGLQKWLWEARNSEKK